MRSLERLYDKLFTDNGFNDTFGSYKWLTRQGGGREVLEFPVTRFTLYVLLVQRRHSPGGLCCIFLSSTGSIQSGAQRACQVIVTVVCYSVRHPTVSHVFP
ncbi:hypothetical protein BgiMline_032988 [Biomphalaria glabrata]